MTRGRTFNLMPSPCLTLLIADRWLIKHNLSKRAHSHSGADSSVFGNEAHFCFAPSNKPGQHDSSTVDPPPQFLPSSDPVPLIDVPTQR